MYKFNDECDYLCGYGIDYFDKMQIKNHSDEF